MVYVNGKKVGGNDNICKFTAYVSPYFVVSNGGAYTKHIYAASQRIASKLGNVDGFGADPRRVEMAGGKSILLLSSRPSWISSYVADADGHIAQHVEYYFVDLIFIN